MLLFEVICLYARKKQKGAGNPRLHTTSHTTKWIDYSTSMTDNTRGPLDVQPSCPDQSNLFGCHEGHQVPDIQCPE